MAPLEGRERQPPGPLFANYTRSSGSTQGRDGKNRALALRKQAAEGESRGLGATRACLRAVRAPCNRSHSRLVGGRSLLQSIHGDSNPSRREPQKHPNVGAFTLRTPLIPILHRTSQRRPVALPAFRRTARRGGVRDALACSG